MEDLTLKKLLTRVFKDVDFDKKLYKKLVIYKNKLITKNTDHSEFFSGVLTGINKLTYTTSEQETLFDDILKIDVNIIRTELKYIKAIEPNWQVANDIFNLVMIYTAFRFRTNNKLSLKDRETSCLLALYLLNYRTICAKHTQFFNYPLKRTVALAAYENLSMKYLIRQHKSWDDVLKHRAEKLYESKNHNSTLTKFNSDDAIVIVLNDVYSRINSTFKLIYRVSAKVNDNNSGVSLSSLSSTTPDGKDVFAENFGGVESYVNYIDTILADKHSYIKDDLIDITVDVLPTANPDNVKDTLEFMSDSTFTPLGLKIIKFNKLVIEHAFDYLKNSESGDDLSSFLFKLRGAYTSSRSSNSNLQELRELGIEIVKEATGKTNKQLIASTRTCVMLYIFLRTYTKDSFR